MAQIQAHRKTTTEVVTELQAKSYQHQLQIENIEQQIAHLRHQSFELGKSLAENENEMVRTKNYFSPLYSLPVEILRHIFSLCQSPPDPCGPKWFPIVNNTVSLVGHRPPVQVLISHVSTRFRDIALSTPDLWTNIVVEITNPSSVMKLRAYLKLSAPYTIDVTLHATREVSNDELQIACIPLIPHVDRMGTLTVNFYDNVTLALFLRGLKNKNARRLTTLTARCNNSLIDYHLHLHTAPVAWAGTVHESLTPFFAGAPGLTSVVLERVLPGITPWNPTIRRMRLQVPAAPSPKQWLPTLSSFSGLVAFSLEDWYFGQNLANQIDIITLPHLRYLKLSGRPGSNPLHLTTWLGIVRMPKLESLGFMFDSAVDVASLFYLLSGTNCQNFPSLRMLSFWCPNPPVVPPLARAIHLSLLDEPSTCISNPFEHVEQLALVGLSYMDVLLKIIFTTKVYSIPRLPKLKLLSLDTKLLELEDVEGVITSRGIAGCPIPRMEVDRTFTRPYWGPEIIRFFRTNVELYEFDSEEFLGRLESVFFPPLEQLS